MENYIIEILLGLIAIMLLVLIAKPFFNSFLRKQQDRGAQIATTHIFNQVKTAGFIDIILDGRRITLVEKVQPKEEKTKKK